MVFDCRRQRPVSLADIGCVILWWILKSMMFKEVQIQSKGIKPFLQYCLSLYSNNSCRLGCAFFKIFKIKSGGRWQDSESEKKTKQTRFVKRHMALIVPGLSPLWVHRGSWRSFHSDGFCTNSSAFDISLLRWWSYLLGRTLL